MEARFDKDQDKLYRKIYGAVAWPGKRPGFAVVIGQNLAPPGNLVLLDELEDSDTRALVRGCGGLDYFYRPDAWLGDPGNQAAMTFIAEMNRENREARQQYGRDFTLRRSRVLDIKNTFAYLLPTLKKTLGNGRLRLKEGKLKSYMLQPQASDLPAIEFGDYPAIEALAFAVLELERTRESRPRQQYALNDYPRM